MKIYRNIVFVLLLSLVVIGWQSPASAQSPDDVLQQHDPHANAAPAPAVSLPTSESADTTVEPIVAKTGILLSRAKKTKINSVSQKINNIALTFPKIYNGYKKFPYAAGTEGGNLGCGNVVSAVLKKAGVKVWSLSVDGVKSQLLSLKAPNNWKVVHPPPYQPGDVVIWSPPKGNRNGHIGIVVKNGNTFSAMNNSSSKRKPVLSTPVNHRKIASVLRKA